MRVYHGGAAWADGTDFANQFEAAAALHKPPLYVRLRSPFAYANTTSIEAAVASATSLELNIFVAVVFEINLRAFFRAAERGGLLQAGNAWVLVDGSQMVSPFMDPSLQRLLHGVLTYQYRVERTSPLEQLWPTLDSRSCAPEKGDDPFPPSFNLSRTRIFERPPPDTALLAYDGVVALALAMDRVDDPTKGQEVLAALRALALRGVSGPLGFTPTLDRKLGAMSFGFDNLLYSDSNGIAAVAVSPLAAQLSNGTTKAIIWPGGALTPPPDNLARGCPPNFEPQLTQSTTAGGGVDDDSALSACDATHPLLKYCEPCPKWKHKPAHGDHACEWVEGLYVLVAFGVVLVLALFAMLVACRVRQRLRSFDAALQAHTAQKEYEGQRVRAAVLNLTKIRHPLCVLRLDRFISLGELMPHEHCRNQAQLTILDTWEDAVAFARFNPIVFISHQWLGTDEPDRNGVQYGAMVAACRALCSERRIADPSLVYVWVDYLSIPQANADTKLASIASIAVFVCCCKYFIVCAPDALHADYGSQCNEKTYLCRGWCRVEQWAFMSMHGVDPMFLFGARRQLTALESSKAWIEEFMVVMGGTFSVEADKAVLVDVILGLYGFAKVCQTHDAQAQDSPLPSPGAADLSDVGDATATDGHVAKASADASADEGERPVRSPPERPALGRSSSSRAYHAKAISVLDLIKDNRKSVFPSEYFGVLVNRLESELEQAVGSRNNSEIPERSVWPTSKPTRWAAAKRWAAERWAVISNLGVTAVPSTPRSPRGRQSHRGPLRRPVRQSVFTDDDCADVLEARQAYLAIRGASLPQRLADLSQVLNTAGHGHHLVDGGQSSVRRNYAACRAGEGSLSVMTVEAGAPKATGRVLSHAFVKALSANRFSLRTRASRESNSSNASYQSSSSRQSGRPSRQSGRLSTNCHTVASQSEVDPPHTPGANAAVSAALQPADNPDLGRDVLHRSEGLTSLTIELPPEGTPPVARRWGRNGVRSVQVPGGGATPLAPGPCQMAEVSATDVAYRINEEQEASDEIQTER